MRIIIQRVARASVTSNGTHKESIGKGLMVLVGFVDEDTQQDIDWIVHKLINLRIFNDKEGKMNRSVIDIDGDILVVSQFTLFASTKKGFRPSYQRAAQAEVATTLFDQFKQGLRSEFTGEVKSGIFGADMQVELINDGPVTIQIDSQQRD